MSNREIDAASPRLVASRDHAAAQPPLKGRQLSVALARVLLSEWLTAVATVFGIVAVTVVLLLLAHRRYTSTASFVVEAAPSAGMSSAMAIISQLNPNLAGGDSPKFYVDLIQSRPVLEGLLALHPAESCGDADHRSVLDRLDPSGDTPLEQRASGLETMRSRVGSSYDLRTGVISVSVEAECPRLAKELTDSLIAAINAFNVDRRQTRAKLRRQFSEERASEAENSLRAAEDEQAAFLATNRVIASPQLKLANDRLERRVSMRSEIATALRREASTARLDEINSIPVITVIEPADVPVKASYPKRRVIAVLVAMLAGILGVGLALIRGLMRNQPADGDPDVATLRADARRLLTALKPRAR